MGHAGGGSEIRLSLEEVANHATEASCWLVLRDSVYDVTDFAAVHPGGKKMLLSYAGKDATAMFDQMHTQAVFESVAATYRIGALGDSIPWAGPEVQAEAATAASSSPPPVGHGVGAAAAAEAVAPAPEEPERLNWRIDSPFPSNSFDDSGLEAVRFKWSLADEFTRRDDGAQEEFKLRSYLRPLDLARDWIHVSSPKTYAYQMSIRKRLCDECPEGVLISEPGSLGAQLELLHLLLDWLPVRYPTRFAVDWGAGTVRTLTEGYRHTFLVADYAQRPIHLCAMLVQEELALMREEPCPPEQDEQEGGIGLQHRFVAGVSCFSFNLLPKRGKIMSEIHHPHVPGFQSDLQHAMTRFFTELEPDAADCRWRSNFGFNIHGGCAAGNRKTASSFRNFPYVLSRACLGKPSWVFVCKYFN